VRPLTYIVITDFKFQLYMPHIAAAIAAFSVVSFVITCDDLTAPEIEIQRKTLKISRQYYFCNHHRWFSV